MQPGRIVGSRLAALLLLAVAAPAQTLELSVHELDIAENVREEIAEAVASGGWRTAESMLYRASEDKPGDAGLLRALAVAHFQTGRYWAAAAAFKGSDRIETLDPAHRFALATAYLRLDRRHWARAELERLVAEHPAEKDYRFALSEVFYFYQWFGQAVEQLEQVIRLDSSFSPAYDRLGQCFEAAGQHEKALPEYRRARTLDEASGRQSPWPAFHLGSLQHDLGRLEEAKAALLGALAVDASQAAIHYELGVVLKKLEEWAAAARSLRVAVELDPSNAKALPALSQVYRRMGRADLSAEALKHFHKLRGNKTTDAPE